MATGWFLERHYINHCQTAAVVFFFFSTPAAVFGVETVC